MVKLSEGNLRSLGKVISWRICLTISHVVNGFLATGSLVMGLKIAGAAAIINSILYWGHERSWNLTQWKRLYHISLRFTETHPRSLSKMISWRLLITCSNFFIPFFLTGSWGSATIFLGLATVVNMLIFWAHERAWNRVVWDKVVKDIS
jgi:uncharacterized membrane protein